MYWFFLYLAMIESYCTNITAPPTVAAQTALTIWAALTWVSIGVQVVSVGAGGVVTGGLQLSISSIRLVYPVLAIAVSSTWSWSEPSILWMATESG